jgi:hypothetical protein
LIYIWRPAYGFLRKIRAFFVAETEGQLQRITSQLSELETHLTAIESDQRAQWAAFEQLYLCFLSDPDRNTRSQLEQFLELERRNPAHPADPPDRSEGSFEN